MKRKIEFRGKNTDSDEWLYGDLQRNAYGLIAVIPSSENDCKAIPSNYEVDENSIGQFVKEFRGKKFYEGDIAITKDPDEPLRVVLTWIEENAMFAWLTVQEYLSYKRNDRNDMNFTLLLTCYAVGDDMLKDLKVIGNIFDNRELLDEDLNMPNKLKK